MLRGCEQALSEHRLRLIQLEWNTASMDAVGADRQQVADLLVTKGYRLYRPDGSGVLKPLVDVGFGPDVFARPDPIWSDTSRTLWDQRIPHSHDMSGALRSWPES